MATSSLGLALTTGARRMLGVRPQLMHNANLAFAASELLFNNLPVLPLHFIFGALFGVQYVLLSWWWVRRTGIVYYPFLVRHTHTQASNP